MNTHEPFRLNAWVKDFLEHYPGIGDDQGRGKVGFVAKVPSIDWSEELVNTFDKIAKLAPNDSAAAHAAAELAKEGHEDIARGDPIILCAENASAPEYAVVYWLFKLCYDALPEVGEYMARRDITTLGFDKDRPRIIIKEMKSDAYRYRGIISTVLNGKRIDPRQLCRLVERFVAIKRASYEYYRLNELVNLDWVASRYRELLAAEMKKRAQ